ncbi:MAG: DinB family protein [Acidobacteria bacterium]|nr:DinB family protein [Acidobacteriota bacterium]
MRTLVQAILICFVAPPLVAFAQQQTTVAPASQVSPLIEDSAERYDGVKKILRRTAEIMPEENYGFKSANDVRSFGQIVGHVADAQYVFCSRVLGEQNPSPGVEKNITSKGELITALDAAFAYCERAYDGMTDASAIETVRFMGGDNPKFGVLSVNQIHTIEHYGNLVTYLRMNDLVPPTSDPDFMKQLQKKK